MLSAVLNSLSLGYADDMAFLVHILTIVYLIQLKLKIRKIPLFQKRHAGLNPRDQIPNDNKNYMHFTHRVYGQKLSQQSDTKYLGLMIERVVTMKINARMIQAFWHKCRLAVVYNR